VATILTDGTVLLRPLVMEDIEPLWGLYSPDIFEHMLNKIESKEHLEAWISSSLKAEGSLTFTIQHAQTYEIMGTTRIYSIDLINRTCEIGSTFYGEAYQRTGINTKTKMLLLSYCFDTLGMMRVQFKTDIENERSQRALERLGATREGVLRNERVRSNGKVRHAVVYSIVDSEWPIVKVHIEMLMNKYTV